MTHLSPYQLEARLEAAAHAPITDRDAAISPSRLATSYGYHSFYLVVTALCISLWPLAIGAPLWLDETISFWQSNEGVSRALSSPNFLFGSYPFILWCTRKIFGTSEIGLRIPSVLAMLAAVWLLYLSARELFDTDVALTAAIIFCLHPIVVFSSIDARPYAFALLATNAAILILLRLRRSDSLWPPALLGICCAGIIYFHLMYAVILPAIALCFVAFKIADRATFWRQANVALGSFALAILPLIPGVLYIFRTRGTHVFEKAPGLIELLWTIAPGWLAPVAALTILFATATRHPFVRERIESWRLFFCLSIEFIPILILYGVSVATPIHIFVPRYRLVAIPGIALCWALLIGRINSRTLRVFFCVALVGITAYRTFTSPDSRKHGYSWKYALAMAEKNASIDNSPVLICSDLPESNYVRMPVNSAKDSALFAPLSYYKLSVPVVPLPRALNDEAIRVASDFLKTATAKHQRFLALAWEPSYPTLDWLAKDTARVYQSRVVGVYDGVKVVEFTFRTADAQTQ